MIKPKVRSANRRAVKVLAPVIPFSSKFEVTLGSDPELHIQERDTGKIVSALRILNQTKENPISLGDDAKMYADNVLIECAFDPAPSYDEIVERYRVVFQRMQKKLGGRYRLLAKAAHVYDEDELQDPRAKEIGCVSSLDAYKRCVHYPAPFSDGLRTTSMHLHIWNKHYQQEPEGKLMTMPSREEAVRLLDIYVGCSSILFDKDETSHERRRLYGTAGNFRATQGGVEYRVLGSYGLRTPELTKLVWDLVRHTMTHVANDTAAEVFNVCPPAKVQEAINENRPKLARELLVAAELPADLMRRVEANYVTPSLEEAWGLTA